MSAPPKRTAAVGPLALQAAIGLGAVLLIWGAVHNAQVNLEALGLTSGFGFLERTVGWGYSFSLIERSITDTYARTLSIGVMNTAFLGLITIATSTVLGVIIGTLRDVPNIALRSVADCFVHVFRNIPLILQLVFTYSILIHMPGPRQAMTLGETVFLSNRGLMLPGMNVGVGEALILFGGICFLIWFVFRHTTGTPGKKVLFSLFGSGAIILFGGAMLAPAGESIVSIPALKGLRFQGGITVSIELVAMILSITLYGAAYIAEVVRGGLREVPRGLVEAGGALGLSDLQVWRKIKLPLAFRTILPPLGNQWIFIMKATTLGVAIGFSDLFYLVSTSITQSGQTLELIFLLMAAFLLINYTLAQLVNLMNARLKLKGH